MAMVLLLLCAAQFMIVLDVTIVAVALPAIRDDLGFSASGLQWVITAYTLAFGGLLVSAGRAADLFGRRRLFMLGLALFAAASAGCGLATSVPLLVAMRAVQGVGAALLAPAALALVSGLREQGRALAIWTAAAAGGGAAGWVLGGVLTETVGWPAIFLANVPVGIVGVALAPRVLPEGRGEAALGEAGRGEAVPGEAARGKAPPGAGRGEAPRGMAAPDAAGRRGTPYVGGAIARLDLTGAALVTAGLAALVYGLGHHVAGLLAGVTLLAVFALVERRVDAPLLPPGTFADRTFARATLVALALTASTTPAMLLSILEQRDASPVEIGLACVPFNVAVIAGSMLGGRVRVPMALGLVGVAAGVLLVGVATLPGYVLMGASLGATSVASTASGTAALGANRGLASGLLTAAAQIGPALGLAVAMSYTAAAAVAAAAIVPFAQLNRRVKQTESRACAYAPQQGHRS